jgi:hypothetical protein
MRKMLLLTMLQAIQKQAPPPGAKTLGVHAVPISEITLTPAPTASAHISYP